MVKLHYIYYVIIYDQLLADRYLTEITDQTITQEKLFMRNTSRGNLALIFANPDSNTRAEGTVQIGLINNTGTGENLIWDFEWKYKQLVKPGYFAYSCKYGLLELVERINKLGSKDFTAESWKLLQEVLNGDDVQDVIKDENALDAYIKKAYDALYDAFSKLEEVTEAVKKDLLNSLINTIKELIVLKVSKELNVPVVDHYNTWKKLEVDNPHIKQTFLNEDYKLNHRGHLRVAQDMMKALGIFDANSLSGGKLVDMKYDATEGLTELKKELSELISKAKKSIEDNKENVYSEVLKSALIADIKAAEREITKNNSTIVTTSNTVRFLSESLAIFETSIEEVEIDYGCDVNKHGAVTVADLALVSKNYNKNNKDANWDVIKIYDVNKDGVVNDADIQKVMDKILE